MADTTQSGRGGGAVQMFDTQHDLDKSKREAMVRLLNQRLADTLDLFTQAKQAHWNVKGPRFYALHLVFDEVAEKVFPHIDLIAERATALGGTALGTVRNAAQNSQLPEFPTSPHEETAYVEAMVSRLAGHASNVREAIEEAEEAGDQGTADLFTEIVRNVDKALYFVESHVQRDR